MTALAVRHYPESSVAYLFFELLNIAQHLFRFDFMVKPWLSGFQLFGNSLPSQGIKETKFRCICPIYWKLIFNPLEPGVAFLYPLKTSENL